MIVVFDYKTGNVGSILNMLKKIGAEGKVSSAAEDINNATKLILPGVGSFDHGMTNMKKLDSFFTLEENVLRKKKPILGICLGMQLLSRASEEGSLPGLGWIDFKCVRFRFTETVHNKIPHMGWNYVTVKKESALTYGLDNETRFYFVHSYHAVCDNQADVLMESKYGYDFVSAVSSENIYGVQFHPEKSHKYGLQLLKNFVERC